VCLHRTHHLVARNLVSHRASRIASLRSYRLPVPGLSLFLLLSRHPFRVRLVLAQQSDLRTSKRQTAARDAGPGLPQPDICDIRESALRILCAGTRFAVPCSSDYKCSEPLEYLTRLFTRGLACLHICTLRT
jgi:hypothetical protein